MIKQKTSWQLDKNLPTPFDAGQEFDRLFGEQCKQTDFARRIAVISLFAAFIISLTSIVYAINRPKQAIIPVVITDWGEAKYAGDISKMSYQHIRIPEIAIQYQLRKFITNMYSVPADADVLKDNLRDCYASLTAVAAQKFSNILKQDSPLKEFGSKNVTVSIESVLSLSADSYQVDFIVNTARPDNSYQTHDRLRAVLTTQLLEPAKEDQIKNPLGIYISGFDIAPVEGDKNE
jgi:type IV secretion system protein TrbF